MCRLLLYQGPEIPISKLLFGPEHSIIRQSFQAREMLSGSNNEDGFGIAWYQPSLSRKPAVYRNILPITNDVNLPSMTEQIASGLIFAHVRGASDGMPVTMSNTHPFFWKRYVFMHNGAVDDFRSKIFTQIIDRIHPALWPVIKGNTDSEHFFALWLSELGLKEDATQDEQVRALRSAIGILESLAKKNGTELVLNIGISDGKDMIAVRYHEGKRKATLYYNEMPSQFPGALLVASEKLFEDPAWKPVPERSILIAEHGQKTRIEPV